MAGVTPLIRGETASEPESYTKSIGYTAPAAYYFTPDELSGLVALLMVYSPKLNRLDMIAPKGAHPNTD
jgi:hypothetical protein